MKFSEIKSFIEDNHLDEDIDLYIMSDTDELVDRQQLDKYAVYFDDYGAELIFILQEVAMREINLPIKKHSIWLDLTPEEKQVCRYLEHATRESLYRVVRDTI